MSMIELVRIALQPPKKKKPNSNRKKKENNLFLCPVCNTVWQTYSRSWEKLFGFVKYGQKIKVCPDCQENLVKKVKNRRKL